MSTKNNHVRCRSKIPVEASFMMMNQVDSSSFDDNKDDDKKPKRMISRLSQQVSRIKRSLILRFKRR